MFSIFEFRVDDLVEFYEGSDEFLPHHSLDLPGGVLQPEVIDLILPCHILGEFIIDGDGGVELLGEDGADLCLIDVYPKGLIVLLLIFLLE